MVRKYKYKYKSRYSKKYRRYRTISYNYFKVKAEFLDRIYYPDQAGHAIFHSKRNDGVAANRYLLTNQNVFEGYTYLNTLAGIFSYYKLIGIRLEVTPDARNQSIGVATAEPTLLLSYRAGNSNSQTINEMKANNQTLVMNSVQKQVRYFRVFNDDGKYSATNVVIPGAFTLLSDTQGNGYEESPSYKVRIIMYLLYKYSKA